MIWARTTQDTFLSPISKIWTCWCPEGYLKLTLKKRFLIVIFILVDLKEILWIGSKHSQKAWDSQGFGVMDDLGHDGDFDHHDLIPLSTIRSGIDHQNCSQDYWIWGLRRLSSGLLVEPLLPIDRNGVGRPRDDGDEVQPIAQQSWWLTWTYPGPSVNGLEMTWWGSVGDGLRSQVWWWSRQWRS